MTDATETTTVTYQVHDGIAWVKFNRPEKRNCMSPKLNRQMLRVLNELEFRDDVGVLVLTGEGSAWSAGHGSEGILPGDRSSGNSRRAPRPARGLRVVGALALVSKSDHCHGEWLVLWRRLWPAVRLRPRVLRRRCAIRALRDQLGNSARRRRHESSRGTDAHAQGHVPRVARRESDRQASRSRRAGQRIGAWQPARGPGHRDRREAAQEESGIPQSHEGCRTASARNDLRQCRGLSNSGPRGSELA